MGQIYTSCTICPVPTPSVKQSSPHQFPFPTLSSVILSSPNPLLSTNT